MDFLEIISLVIAGILVGFFNTLAGGATVISISLLMLLGLPATVANGTHRVAAALQTFTSVIVYRRKGIIDYRRGLVYAIPVTAGSIAGALTAVRTNEELFGKIIAVVMVGMLFILFYKPSAWRKGNVALQKRKPSLIQHLVFFIIGFYGGFIYIGVGYFLMAAFVFLAGYDLVRSNALKVFVVLIYVIFSLVIYIVSGYIDWTYAFVLSAGQIAGAWIGARLSVEFGFGFIRWIMGVFILVTFCEAFNIFSIRDFIAVLITGG